ncbi:MAG: PorV/PorQ family protein [Candidatus Zixiibacteriota bacterium]
MRFNKYKVALCAAVLLLLPSLAFSQAKVGTTGVNFLELGVSARAMGMAEAFTAGVTDASAVYYNPAGLAYIYGREAMFTHIDLPAGINYEFFALAYPMESVSGVVGLALYALNTGDILRTDYSYPMGRDQDGNEQYFSAGDLAVALSYSRFLTDKFSLGLTVRYIQESLELEKASGWSADVGTCYNSGYRNFKIAMMISNFGPDMKFIKEEFPLPMNFKFGASIDVLSSDNHVLMFAAEGAHPSDNEEKYNIGLEYWFMDKFSIRAGERFNYDSDGFTAGGGLVLPISGNMDLSVDYAYQEFGYLNEVHRFTLGLVF